MSYRFLLSRRWLILTLVAIALIPSMIRLGFWQLHRHEARVASNELIARSLAAEPVPVERLTAPGAALPRERTWRTVTAKGHYEPRYEVVARQRTAADGQQIGYHVITPLVLADGRALLVNRGWIAPGEDITVFPKVPRPPSGEITVTGRLRPDETTATSGIKDKPGMPDRQIMLISSARLARDIPRPLLGGYIELTGTSPRPEGAQPEEVPAPDHDGVGVHLAYAIQWWLFAAMVPVGWVVLARRERKELAESAAKSGAPRSPTAGPPASGPGQTDGEAAAATPRPESARPSQGRSGGSTAQTDGEAGDPRIVTARE